MQVSRRSLTAKTEVSRVPAYPPLSTLPGTQHIILAVLGQQATHLTQRSNERLNSHIYSSIHSVQLGLCNIETCIVDNYDMG